MSVDSRKLFSHPLFVVVAATLCCAVWGSATPFIKMGYLVMFPGGKPDLPSTILFAGIRFALAGLITVAIYSIARRRFLYPKTVTFNGLLMLRLHSVLKG